MAILRSLHFPQCTNLPRFLHMFARLVGTISAGVDSRAIKEERKKARLFIFSLQFIARDVSLSLGAIATDNLSTRVRTYVSDNVSQFQGGCGDKSRILERVYRAPLLGVARARRTHAARVSNRLININPTFLSFPSLSLLVSDKTLNPPRFAQLFSPGHAIDKRRITFSLTTACRVATQLHAAA